MAALTAVHSPICKHKWCAVLSDNSSADLSGLLAIKAVSQTSYIER